MAEGQMCIDRQQCGDTGAHSGITCAIVVTYNPGLDRLAELLDAILSQVSRIVVVDNGSSVDIPAWVAGRGYRDVRVTPLGLNKGIATAHNIGIGYAKEIGAEYVVLLDQDSLPAPDMVEKLRTAVESKVKEGYAVAAAGPRYADERMQNPPPFIRVKGLSICRQLCDNASSIVEVDYLISSGCLLSLAALNAVGDMQEDLFIDYVDIEWGLRAKGLGFQSFGVCAAKMDHNLGDQPFVFMSKRIPSHSPLRHYYHFRNAIWLYRRHWVPLHWKCADGIRLLLKYGFYSLYAKPRFEHLHMMTLGIWHGLLGRMGRFDKV